METVEFVTPSGHKVYLRPYLTYADKRELRKIYAGYWSLNTQENKTNTEVNGRAVFEAQEYALKAMIDRMVDKDGKTYNGPAAYEAIMFWDNEEDGDAVMAKVDELTSAKQLPADKKKRELIALALFKFHDKGKGKLPEDFDEVYLCDILGISYTTLVEQPDWWIERMELWALQRQKAANAKQQVPK